MYFRWARSAGSTGARRGAPGVGAYAGPQQLQRCLRRAAARGYIVRLHAVINPCFLIHEALDGSWQMRFTLVSYLLCYFSVKVFER